MRLTIGRQIVITCAVIIIAFVSLNLYLQYHNKVVKQEYGRVMENAATLTYAAKDIRAELWKRNTAIRNYMLTGDSRFVQENETSQKVIEEKISNLSALMNDSDGRKEIGILKLAMNEYGKLLTQGVSIRDKLGVEGTVKFLAASGERAGYIEKLVDSFNEYVQQDSQHQINQVEAAELKMTLAIVIFNVLMLLAAAAVSLWLARRISVPLGAMAGAADKIAQGDLRAAEISYQREDEIGDTLKAFLTMVKGLHNLIAQMTATANQVSESSLQLNQITQQSAQAAE